MDSVLKKSDNSMSRKLPYSNYTFSSSETSALTAIVSTRPYAISALYPTLKYIMHPS